MLDRCGRQSPVLIAANSYVNDILIQLFYIMLSYSIWNMIFLPGLLASKVGN